MHIRGGYPHTGGDVLVGGEGYTLSGVGRVGPFMVDIHVRTGGYGYTKGERYIIWGRISQSIHCEFLLRWRCTIFDDFRLKNGIKKPQ